MIRKRRRAQEYDSGQAWSMQQEAGLQLSGESPARRRPWLASHPLLPAAFIGHSFFRRYHRNPRTFLAKRSSHCYVFVTLFASSSHRTPVSPRSNRPDHFFLPLSFPPSATPSHPRHHPHPLPTLDLISPSTTTIANISSSRSCPPHQDRHAPLEERRATTHSR